MGKEKAVKGSSSKNKEGSGGPVVMEKQMKKKKRRTETVEFDAEVDDIENMIPSSVDPSILVKVPGNHRVNLDNVVDGGVKSLINKWNDKSSEPSKSNNDVLHAAEDVIVEDGDSDEEGGAAMVDDFIVNSPSQFRMDDIPMIFKTGTTSTKAATTVGGGERAETAVEDGGASKTAKKYVRRKDKTVGVSNEDGNASGQRSDTSKAKVHDGKMKGHMGDNSKDVVASKNIHAAGNVKLNFAGIFKENRVEGNGFQLQHYDTMEDDVVLDENDEIPVEASWGYCLIGCFTGPFPGRIALNAIVNGWGVSCRVMPYGKGWTVFKFKSEQDRAVVLQGGPYLQYGKTLMLKKVDNDVMLTDDLFMMVPTWVQLKDVPPSVWSVSGLSKLSSKVGLPLYTDKVTKERSKMNFARCLIEVDVSKPPVLEFGVKMSNDRRYVQKVAYEHYPDYCCECKMFGHNFFKCPKLHKDTPTSNGIEPFGDVRPTDPYMPKRRVENKGKGPSNFAPNSAQKSAQNSAQKTAPISVPSSSNTRPNKNRFDVLSAKGSMEFRDVSIAEQEPNMSVFGTAFGTDLNGSTEKDLREDDSDGDAEDHILGAGVYDNAEQEIGIAKNVGIELEYDGTWTKVGKKGSRRNKGTKS